MVERRFFFVHLQKTAGTALLRRLRNHFGPDAVYPRPDQQGTADAVLDVDLLRSRLAASPATRVVTGHFPLATVERLDGRFSTFTVLRDPVDRVLSFLRHQNEVEPRFAGMSLEEIYEDPISTGPLVSNHMTRMLSLSAAEMTIGALTPMTVDDQKVADACHALEHRVDVFGLQEEFDTFCRDLERTFGWDLGDPVFMNRTKDSEASGDLRERIAADNAGDLAVYAFAETLWRRRHPTRLDG